VAQLVNAGCAALSYYTDMLFRSSVFILIASSVLIAGCRTPGSGDHAASHRSSTHAIALKPAPISDPDFAVTSISNF